MAKARPIHLQWTSVWTAQSKGLWIEHIPLAFHEDGLQIKPLAYWGNLSLSSNYKALKGTLRSVMSL